MVLNTWHDFFVARAENEAGNKNTAVFTAAWAQANPNDAKIALLTNDASTAFLAVDATNNVVIVHSVRNFGGTILHPAHRFGALIGNGRLASPIIVDEASFLRHVNIATPPFHQITNCLTRAEIEGLRRPNQRAAHTFHGCASFLPAPWLLQGISGANTSEPTSLILAAAEAAENFDIEHNGDPNYLADSEEQLEDFVLWAWGAMAGKIPRLVYSVDPNDENLRIYCENRHTTTFQRNLDQGVRFAFPGDRADLPPAIAPGIAPGGIPPDVFNFLGTSIARQAEALEAITTTNENTLNFQRDKENKKKDRFNKFHPNVKQMILWASAVDNEDVPTVPEDTCERFMNAISQGIAEQELSMQFKSMDLGEVAYATGLTLNLYNGKFLYSVRHNPSNFSCFSVHEGTHLDEEEQQNRQLLLHLVETKGKGQSIEEIKAMNKQILKAPTKYDEMKTQFEYFHGLCQMFFGKFSWPSASMQSLLESLEKNKSSFRARERTDTRFCSKFMYAVDTRYQLFLEDCMTATTRDRVDDGALNFNPMIEMVRYGTFDCRLPSVFSSPPKPKQDDGAAAGIQKRKGNQDAAEGRKKRDQQNNGEVREQKNRITNPEPPIEAFKLRPGETWARTFAHKNISGRVPWGSGPENCKMCPRWFIMNQCFDDCYHAASHVKESEVPAEKLTAFSAYMKAIRSNNN